MNRYISIALPIFFLISMLTSQAQQAPQPKKTFIDYFLPIPIIGSLSKDAWGSSLVGPRDQSNGLEDPTMQHYNYWDGGIIKGPDGKYHMFAARWDQSLGFDHWYTSKAIHAVSDNLFGPYVDKGPCWPDNKGGLGHNVSPIVMPDGTYAIVVSETRHGDVFVSKSLDGPWTQLGSLKVADGPHKNLGSMSNVRPMVRPDGKFEIVARSGGIWISQDGILGPYVIQDFSIYPKIPKLKGINDLEDPMIWYSGGLYHIIVNSWGSRKTYHITSVDGINDWKYQGIAIDPKSDFIRYTDGTINHWANLERPFVYLENGHVVAVTLAASDFSKNDIKANSGHGSKVLVLPFDGAALDKNDAQ